jgi:hypothetical protein
MRFRLYTLLFGYFLSKYIPPYIPFIRVVTIIVYFGMSILIFANLLVSYNFDYHRPYHQEACEHQIVRWNISHFLWKALPVSPHDVEGRPEGKSSGITETGSIQLEWNESTLQVMLVHVCTELVSDPIRGAVYQNIFGVHSHLHKSVRFVLWHEGQRVGSFLFLVLMILPVILYDSIFKPRMIRFQRYLDQVCIFMRGNLAERITLCLCETRLPLVLAHIIMDYVPENDKAIES